MLPSLPSFPRGAVVASLVGHHAGQSDGPYSQPCCHSPDVAGGAVVYDASPRLTRFQSRPEVDRARDVNAMFQRIHLGDMLGSVLQ